MILKRHCSEGEDDGSEVRARESKRPSTGATVIRDVMNGISLHEFVSKLEPFIQRVVREEVERAIHSSPRSSLNQIESSGARAWQLHFGDKLPSTLFTGSRIESEDNKPIKILILDASSKKRITAGPLSSIKIEVVVLDGDFRADDQEDWTEKEFNTNVVREREGKRPLVTGDLVITLKDGVGYFGDINFTDNSSWIRSRKFRLGARVQNISTEVRIREAISEAFVVKDHRGESYRKHHPPSLGDEIWRLERIAKDGAFHKRLAFHEISTVKDFLKLYVTDPSSLRNIFGGGISNKTWETIIEHATACVLDDDEFYMYYRAAEKVGLVFNSILKVIGATFDGQHYQSLDKLNIFQMWLVEDLRQHAYKNLKELVPIDQPSVGGCPMLLSSLQADPFSSPTLALQNVNFPIAHQEQLEMQLGSTQMTPSPQFTYEVEDGSQLEVSIAQDCHPVQVFSPTLRNSFIMRDSCYGTYGEGCSWWAPSGSLGPDVLSSHLAADDNSLVGSSTWQGNGFLLAPSNQAIDIVPSNFGICISTNAKPKARWRKIRAALKWWIWVRRDAAAKRMGRLLYLDL